MELELKEILEAHSLWLKGKGGKRADLSGANLSSANLISANLCEADLRGADLSGARGLISPIDYISENFEQTAEGFIVYKTFGCYKNPSEKWAIAPGSVIEEEVDYSRTIECGCGINVATLEWVNRNNELRHDVWKCLIKYEWLAGICVPIHTDGKIRAARVQLLEVMKNV